VAADQLIWTELPPTRPAGVFPVGIVYASPVPPPLPESDQAAKADGDPRRATGKKTPTATAADQVRG
jgi:hypothetical protein